MGNAAPQVKPVGGAAQRDPLFYLQHDLPKLIKKNELGTGKFMKSFLCKVEDGVNVVVKVYVRHDGEPLEELSRAKEGIEDVQGKLCALAHPNVLPYQRVVIGQQLRGAKLTGAGYAMRQHFYTSLHDRLSTRPFLSAVEKKWIIYQLFQAVVQCHEADVCHGDIKSENVMVTSWTWIMLTDFASFKPTYLPEDDPTDFNFFFSSSSSAKHRCYLAPERFYSSTAEAEAEAALKGLDGQGSGSSGDNGAEGSGGGRSKRQGKLRKAMDVFSLGCVIAEVLLGAPVLDLPALLQYRAARSGDGSDEAQLLMQKLDKLDAVAEPEVKHLVRSMLQREPAARKDAADYLRRCETVELSGSAHRPLFPTCFGEFLYRFMATVQREVHTPDERILFVCRHYARIMQQCCGVSDPEGAAFFEYFAPPDVAIPGAVLSGDDDNSEGLGDSSSSSSSSASAAITSPSKPSAAGTNAESDFLELDALAEETQRLIASIEAETADVLPPPPAANGASTSDGRSAQPPTPPSYSAGRDASSSSPAPENALIVVAQLVCSCIRHVREPQSKLLALQLMLRFSRHLDDEARLQRLVPYIVALLEGPDQIASVRASAVRVLRDVLGEVTKFAASDADLFPKYIFPTLQKLPTDSEELVRIAFAESLASLAETSRRFLEIAQGLLLSQASGDGNATAGAACSSKAKKEAAKGGEAAFAAKLEQLHGVVSKWIHDLVGDSDNAMGASFSGQSSSGGNGNGGGGGTSAQNRAAARSNLVKRALLRDITRLCIFFGAAGTEQQILPLLITMINDRDWELRYAFCAHIPALGAFLGPVVTENFIMPLSHPLIVDVEELVVSRALRCLATLCELGLLLPGTMVERATYTAPLLLHPSSWVRHGAQLLLASATRRLGPSDSHALVYPNCTNFLRVDLATCVTQRGQGDGGSTNSVSKEVFAAASLAPVSRRSFRLELLNLTDELRGGGSSRSTSSGPTAEAAAAAVAEQKQALADLPQDEKDKLASMRTYLKAAAANLMQKTQTTGGAQQTAAAAAAPATNVGDNMRGNSSNNQAALGRSLKPRGSFLANNDSGRKGLTTPGGGSLSRLQLHSERLNATPSSSLFVPKSAAAVYAASASSLSVAATERDSLLAVRKRFLAHFIEHHGGRPITVWALPLPLHNASKLQSLYGVTTNSRDAVRLARKGSAANPDHPDHYTGNSASDHDQSGDASDRRRNETVSVSDSDASAVAGGNGAALDALGGYGAAMDGVASPAARRVLFAASGEGGADAAALQRRIVALGIPPLPPNLGAPRRSPQSTDGGSGGSGLSGSASASGSGNTTAAAQAAAAARGKEWRPKVGGVIVQTLSEHVPCDEGTSQGAATAMTSGSSAREHSGAVNRLAVSPDHTFFVSASSDGTSRVWATALLDSNAAPRAAAVYAQQSGRILDACSVEQTRSICSGSDSGEVHVWRVDLLDGLQTSGVGATGAGGGNKAMSPASPGHGSSSAAGNTSWRRSGAMGTAEVRRVPMAAEGPVVAVAHYHSDVASVVVYGTQRGFIHGWDLRSEEEAWCLRVPPEVGCLTTLAVGSGPEKHWLAAGTTRGYIAVWDLRFQLLVRLWRHSSKATIYRLATCARLPEDPEGGSSQPLAFVAAGSGELAVWNLNLGGVCRRCFRSLRPQHGLGLAPLPTLDPIPLPAHPGMPLLTASECAAQAAHAATMLGSSAEETPSVRAIMGRISTNGNSYLITGSTDKHIRFWDLATPTKCFTVSGLAPGQPRPTFDSVTFPANPASSLLLCFDADIPMRNQVVPSRLPTLEQRGLVAPYQGHKDAVLDLKGLDLPTKMMLSCSRDGVVKCWK